MHNFLGSFHSKEIPFTFFCPIFYNKLLIMLMLYTNCKMIMVSADERRPFVVCFSQKAQVP